MRMHLEIIIASGGSAFTAIEENRFVRFVAAIVCTSRS
jgi:hypothetical protein